MIAACRYGFVRFSHVQDAQAAISSLDGTTVLGHKLQVKFADADAGPPAAASPSGLTPSDSCYAKHLPASWGVSAALLVSCGGKYAACCLCLLGGRRSLAPIRT